MGCLQHDQSEEVLKEAINNGEYFSTSEVLRCHEALTSWQRITRLVMKIPQLELVENLVLSGQEDLLKIEWRKQTKTRSQLLAEARSLNVKNYGTLTKKELEVEIERYKRDKITRQRHER